MNLNRFFRPALSLENRRRFAHLTAIRVCDICAALFGGLLVLPVIAFLAILIRLDSPGPALFCQERVGRRQQPFVCYKLRTMAKDTRAAGTHEVSVSSVTALGHILRRTKLDELPQLWNVLRGEMSLVGPRPCLPSQNEVIDQRFHRGVYDVRPGITGAAQVLGVDMSTPELLAIKDAAWAMNPNLPAYVGLIFQTITGKGQGDAIKAS